MSMRLSRVGLYTGVTTALWATAACAAEQPFSVTQQLPKAEVSATIKETLLACPDDAANAPDGVPRVRTTAVVEAAYVADAKRSYELTAKGGGWSSVSFDLELTPDGRLVKVNASSEGAGGAALGALFKAVAGLASVAMGKALGPACHPEILKLSRDAQALRAQIAELEAKLAGAASAGKPDAGKTDAVKGDAGKAEGEKGASDAGRLALLKEFLAKKEAQLTLTANLELDPVGVATSTTWSTRRDGPSAYDKWFVLPQDKDQWLVPLGPYGLKGLTGFALQVSTNEAGLVRAESANHVTVENQVAFVQPPPATAIACSWDNKKAACAGVLGAVDLFLPQAAPAKFLTVKNSVFGSRSLSATFAPHGAPLTIGYKTKAQIEQIATAIAGAGEAIGSLKKAPTTELQGKLAETKAQIDLLKAQKELADLQANP